MSFHPSEKSTTSSVGELVANCEAKIMADDAVTELGRNQRGELWVRGPNVMKGYWRNPQATRETKTEDGWLKTGDIAYVDDEGKFYVVDRKKVVYLYQYIKVLCGFILIFLRSLSKSRATRLLRQSSKLYCWSIQPWPMLL